MAKKMLVNASHSEENRVAIVEDGVLTELDIEVAGRESSKGNIYKAVVVRVEAGLQAAFVDYGAERLGFLQIDEINFSTVRTDPQSEDNRRPRINDLLHRGQELLVQIIKEERGTKGAALTTYLSLAGRYMVLMPGSQTRGVSRKAESDAQRKELKKAMSSIDLAEGIGYIVRTAALDQSREELERDYRYLMRLYESIKELEKKVKAPALIYKESNLMIRSIRDYFTTDMDEVLIDDLQLFKEAKNFFQLVMPDQAHLVKQHQERRPIFSRYQIEEQIESLSRNKVPLPSGGSIVIDPTEALVAIDVNSGKMASEQGVEATATKTNLEAAEEIGRQLRLRDLGGLIVIDFIDMRERKHMRQVENQLKKALENDKARVNVGRISQFGLLEMSRQRIKAALTEGSYLTCPHCNGTGHLKSPETQAVALLRKIHASVAKGQVSRVDAHLPMDVAAYLLNHKREELVDMERRHQLQIHIHGNRDFLADQLEIEIQKKDKDKPSQAEYVAAGMLPEDAQEKEKPAEKGKSAAELKPVPTESTEATPQTEAEPEAQMLAENTPEPAKKRRRRKRRKPAPASNGAGDTPDSTTAGDEPEEPEDGVIAPPATTEALSVEEAAVDPPAQKPQRRRRSGNKAKRPAAAATGADSLPTTGSEPETTPKPQSDTPPAAPGSAAESTETKPKRRRSRRKPKTTEKDASAGRATTAAAPTRQASPPPTQTVEAPVKEASQPSGEETITPAATDQPGTEGDQTGSAPPKPPRTRRSRPQPKTAKAPAPAAASSGRKVPARRSRKSAGDDGDATTSGQSEASGKSTADKASRPRRPRTAKKQPATSEPAAQD